VFDTQTPVLTNEKKAEYKKLFGKNEFMVLAVEEIPEEKIEALGHHQFITVEVKGRKMKLTGSMFKLYEPKKCLHTKFFEKLCASQKKVKKE
jgi:hypothetical protein